VRTTGIASWDGDADLSKEVPWFLTGHDAEFEELGFPRERRERAFRGLLKLYPPEVCREIRDGGKYDLGIVLLLFMPYFPSMVDDLLEVGCDVEAVQPWHDHNLLHRLRRWDGYPEAALELKVQANLARAGIKAERVPESPRRKTPEFRIAGERDDLLVEVKLVNNPHLHELAKELGSAIQCRTGSIAGFNLRLLGNESLSERALDYAQHAALLGEQDAIATAFSSCVDRLRQSGCVPGTFDAPPYGCVVATQEPGLGSVTADPLPDLPDEKRAARVVRLIKEAAAQLTAGQGIAVIGLYHAADPFLVEDVLRREEKREPRIFGRCRSVVLCDRLDGPGEYDSTPVFFAFPGRAYRSVTKEHLRLAEIVAGDERRRARHLPRPEEGQPRIRLDTKRRRMTAFKLAHVELKGPGHGVSVFFDGRPPEYHEPPSAVGVPESSAPSSKEPQSPD